MTGVHGRLELPQYKSDNISQAYLDGEHISNGEARRICSGLAGNYLST